MDIYVYIYIYKYAYIYIPHKRSILYDLIKIVHHNYSYYMDFDMGYSMVMIMDISQTVLVNYSCNMGYRL